MFSVSRDIAANAADKYIITSLKLYVDEDLGRNLLPAPKDYDWIKNWFCFIDYNLISKPQKFTECVFTY